MTDATAKHNDTEMSELVKESWHIIKGKVNGNHYANKQEARAIPNARLKQVFGIDNAFTTVSQDEKTEFRRRTVKLMKDASRFNEYPEGGWTALREHAIKISREYIAHVEERIKLPEMVQFITLRLSILYLFPDAPTWGDDDFGDIIYIGRRINELWVESKDKTNLHSTWALEADLQAALRKVTSPPMSNNTRGKSIVDTHAAVGTLGSFYSKLVHLGSKCPQWIINLWSSLHSWMKPAAAETAAAKIPTLEETPDPSVPKRNPMNLILPAYETMWRVVMRTFMEIRYRDAEHGPNWSRTMEEYLDTLKDPACMRKTPLWTSSSNGVKPMDIVKEGLRLYPPTRRVHRSFKTSEGSEIVVADIEKCHRSGALGGDDPLVFRPERWQQICPVERQGMEKGIEKSKRDLKDREEGLGFMPFADSCPAGAGDTKGFGFKMIALLVAVLCTTLGEDWKLELNNLPQDRKQPLESDRTAYENLRLMKS
jgi:hypothetical protein